MVAVLGLIGHLSCCVATLAVSCHCKNSTKATNHYTHHGEVKSVLLQNQEKPAGTQRRHLATSKKKVTFAKTVQ